MKKFLALLIFLPILTLAQSVPTPEGVKYSTKILSVIDGDTVVIAADYLPPPLKPKLSVRIFGVDTPESGFRAKCPEEAAKAARAKAWTQQLIAKGKIHELILYKWDKYGGRVIGDIIVDGQSVRRGLIANGLAREYYGDAKQSWCN